MAEKWAKDESLTVKRLFPLVISIIGENMNIRRFEKATEENGFVASTSMQAERSAFWLTLRPTL